MKPLPSHKDLDISSDPQATDACEVWCSRDLRGGLLRIGDDKPFMRPAKISDVAFDFINAPAPVPWHLFCQRMLSGVNL